MVGAEALEVGACVRVGAPNRAIKTRSKRESGSGAPLFYGLGVLLSLI